MLPWFGCKILKCNMYKVKGWQCAFIWQACGVFLVPGTVQDTVETKPGQAYVLSTDSSERRLIETTIHTSMYTTSKHTKEWLAFVMSVEANASKQGWLRKDDWGAAQSLWVWWLLLCCGQDWQRLVSPSPNLSLEGHLEESVLGQCDLGQQRAWCCFALFWAPGAALGRWRLVWWCFCFAGWCDRMPRWRHAPL